LEGTTSCCGFNGHKWLRKYSVCVWCVCVYVSEQNYLSVGQLLNGNRPKTKQRLEKKKHKGLQIISWNKFDSAHHGIYLDYCSNTKSDVWSGARKKTLLSKGAAELGNAQPFKKEVHAHHHDRLLSFPTSDSGHMWLSAFIDEERRASWLGR